MASLVDTNILVYCFDSRTPSKRDAARTTLRQAGLASSAYIPHQALTEFVSVVTRGASAAHLPLPEATIQVEGFMAAFPILYPDDQMFRTALRGMATYQFSWYDAHLWAYADRYGISEILSEDFDHGRRYGAVRVRNPFVELGLA